MKLSAQGDMRPVVLKSTIDDSADQIFKTTCPGIYLASDFDGEKNVIWGRVISSRTGHASDPEIRHKGSSGGVVSALGVWLLESKQVEFVAQIVASTQDPLRNELQMSRTRSDVIRAAGSRYAPTAPLEQLKQILDLGEKFAFVGKPCDIAAIRQYGRHDNRVQELMVCAISFMCAGVPSMRGTHELLEKLGTVAEEVVSFRYRGDGWPGTARAVTRKGVVLETDYSTSWGTILNKHLQFRCKICPDGTGEFADITCADAWYGKDGYPDFDERDGRSLILARTPRGEALVVGASESARISMDDLPVDAVAEMQPYQVQRKQVAMARIGGFWLAGRKVPRFKNLRLLSATLQAKKIELIRNMWGAFRRTRKVE